MDYVLLSNVQLESRNLFGSRNLGELESQIETAINSLQLNYLLIGKLLATIDFNYYYTNYSITSEDGSTRIVSTIEEYGLVRFGMSRTTVKNAIGVYNSFCLNGNLRNGFSGYGFSQLCELLPLTKTSEYDTDYGFYPKWAKEEIKPEMTVKEIRKVKSLHLKKKTKVVKNVASEESNEDSAPAVPDDIANLNEGDGKFKSFKNDEERLRFLMNYNKWPVFAFNDFLNITYYRAKTITGSYLIAVEWEDHSQYYEKKYGGVKFNFYIKRPDKEFNLDPISQTGMVKIMREEGLHCLSSLVDEIIGKK